MGEEGTFSICTFWACEAAARLGMFKKEYLEKGRLMFEQMLGYANHLGLYSEEIGKRGEHLGNFPQAFTHLALISAAINLDRGLNNERGAGNMHQHEVDSPKPVSSSSRKQHTAHTSLPARSLQSDRLTSAARVVMMCVQTARVLGL